MANEEIFVFETANKENVVLGLKTYFASGVSTKDITRIENADLALANALGKKSGKKF